MSNRMGSGKCMRVVLGLSAGLFAAGAAPASAQGGSPAVMLSADTPVAVTGGQIQGTAAAADPDVVAFKGVPFAAPPVGDLRWRPPAAVVAWAGVRDAGEAGPICAQGAGGGVGQSEDCLFLNVWAPK